MIEDRARKLVADIQAAGDTWTPAERIDAIGELEATIAMLQAQLNVEVVTYADQRKAADKASGTPAGSAGRGAAVEIAMARGVSRATVDYQLAFARQLVSDHPRLLAACLDGQVAAVHGDGTGSVSALLPAEQAVACWQALDHDARGMRADRDERSLNDLMCDLLVERVTGQVEATNLHLEVGIVISLSSLLGVDGQPAKLVGHKGGDYGVLPAGLARQLATDGPAWARRLVCDPIDGTLLSMDPTRRLFGGALRKFIVYRDGTTGGRSRIRRSTRSTTSCGTPTADPPHPPTLRASASPTTRSATCRAGASRPPTATPRRASDGPHRPGSVTNRDHRPSSVMAAVDRPDWAASGDADRADPLSRSTRTMSTPSTSAPVTIGRLADVLRVGIAGSGGTLAQCGTDVGRLTSAAQASEPEGVQVESDVLPSHDERRRRASRGVFREVDHDRVTSHRKTS
jgi:hypothetical protein